MSWLWAAWATDDFKKRSARRCCYCQLPATHVVKWPRRSVVDADGNDILAVLRNYVCAAHCRRVLDYQNRQLGRRRPVRSYRFRR